MLSLLAETAFCCLRIVSPLCVCVCVCVCFVNYRGMCSSFDGVLFMKNVNKLLMSSSSNRISSHNDAWRARS